MHTNGCISALQLIGILQNNRQTFNYASEILQCTLQDKLLSEYNDKSVVLRGDGRCDSPGKSAKYCTYSLMDSENDKILYVETVDKHKVGLKSPNMEREAFKRSMQYLTNKKGIKISEIVTDASTAVISIAGTS